MVYSHNLYADYARDLADRTSRLPISLASKVFRAPVDVLRWPFKMARKPFGLLKELNYVTILERGPRRSRTFGKKQGLRKFQARERLSRRFAKKANTLATKGTARQLPDIKEETREGIFAE